MNGPLKFLADASLAGLARWLRLLGFDAEVYFGPAGRPMMKDDVPVYVFENCEEYFKCHRCGKVYWPGTHVRNTRQFLNKNNIRIDI